MIHIGNRMHVLAATLFIILVLDVKCEVVKVDLTRGMQLFDGLGGISGGGATSKLLNTYKNPTKSELYDLLFKPGYAASLHILKVEIGGDGDSTEGCEASHQHSEDDLNFNRGYEWEILKQAKLRNPNIKLIGLPWTLPGWLSNPNQNPFQNPQNRTSVAQYIVRWLKGARDVHKLTFDYLGVINEPHYDITPASDLMEYTILLRSMLENSGFDQIKLIVGDVKGWDVAQLVINNFKYADAIDIVSSHYPGEVSDSQAGETGKTLWAAEDYSTIDNYNGAACLARIINRNYVHGNMTCTIVWNMIAAYYSKMPFPNEGLFTANEPWSGHFSINPPLWVMAHTTLFTKPGWSYIQLERRGNLTNGGTMVALTDPTETELTVVIETMSYMISRCIRPHTPPYNVTASDVTIQLTGEIAQRVKMLYRWESHIAKSGCTMMVQKKSLFGKNGQFSIGVINPDTLITLSTVKYAGPPSPKIPTPTPFPKVHKDTFTQYSPYTEPDYLTSQTGFFETNNEGALTQVAMKPVFEFCPSFKAGHDHAPPFIVMYSNLTDYKTGFKLSVSGKFVGKTTPEGSGIFIAALVQNVGCQIKNTHGLFLVANVSDSVEKNCGFYKSFTFDRNNTVTAKSCDFPHSEGKTLSISVYPNTTVELSIEQTTLFTFKNPLFARNGFIGFGCTVYGECQYDSFSIRPF